MLELDTFNARWISRRTGRGSEGAEEMGGNDDCIGTHPNIRNEWYSRSTDIRENIDYLQGQMSSL